MKNYFKKYILLTSICIICCSCLFSCSQEKKPNYELPIGRYFLDGNNDSQYIEVISNSELELINFDFSDLSSIFDMEDTDATGNNIERSLQERILYSLESDGNVLFVYAQVTSFSGMRLQYDDNLKQIIMFEEKYILEG